MTPHGRASSSAAATLESSLRRLSLAAKLAGMRGEGRAAGPVEVIAPPGVRASIDRPRGVRLRTARMTLRPLEPGDLGAFLRMIRASREHLNAFCPLHAQGSCGEDDHETFVRQLELSRGAVSTGRAVRLNGFLDDGTLVGGFNLNDIQRGLENVAELVIWVGVEHTGMGYAAEGLSRLLEHGFADPPRGLGLHRVIGLVAPENAACMRMLRKWGFRAEPNEGQLELTIGDRRIAHDIYSLFAPVPADAQIEGKPSIPQQVVGTGLMSILRTEAAHRPGHGEP